MGRALPDARDGLKPVHRRILYGMHILRLDPGTAFKKCAKIVGDVMGSFHPHGDQAIYEALVRLAQDFVSRYPLVEGQGNFGNIDGDNAAAYRYTEARMTDVARLIMEGVDEDSVDWRDNYSGDAKEPIVMPSAVPNLLANGAQGIAVGMATSIPPHNIAELCDAALYLIAHPDADAEALATFVPGPDFPTGGVVIDDKSAIIETYRTGRGAFRVRARWTKEDTGRGGWVAVVTEIPYGVQKSRLIEQIANLLNERKIPLLADVRDESTEDVRIVLEPRTRAVEPETLMESLFRLTELEARVSVNMNVLVDGVTPRVVSLGEALRQWLDHRRNVLVRRSRHRLAAIDKRLELLAGMIIVFLNLDEVIRIVREDDDPKEALKARFSLTELQAVYVLDTRLRSLRRLEEMALRKEQDDLSKEKATIEALLASEKKQWQMIAVEIRDVKKKFGPDTKLGRRRTSFEAAPDVIVADLAEAMIEREPLTIVVSQKGWIRALKGQVADLSTATFKGDDGLKTVVLRRDDLEDSGAGERRQGVHARRLQTAGRARAGRADPPHGRHRRERFDRRRLGLRGGREAPHRVERRQRLRRRRGRASVLDPQGQGGAQRRRAGDRGADRSRRRRPCRDHRAEPQAAGVPVRAAQRDGARQGHAASTLQGRRHFRRQGLRHRRRPHLARLGRAHVHRRQARAQGVDRQPRRSRPPAAEGLSEEQQVRRLATGQPSRLRLWSGSIVFNRLGA